MKRARPQDNSGGGGQRTRSTARTRAGRKRRPTAKAAEAAAAGMIAATPWPAASAIGSASATASGRVTASDSQVRELRPEYPTSGVRTRDGPADGDSPSESPGAASTHTPALPDASDGHVRARGGLRSGAQRAVRIATARLVPVPRPSARAATARFTGAGGDACGDIAVRRNRLQLMAAAAGAAADNGVVRHVDGRRTHPTSQLGAVRPPIPIPDWQSDAAASRDSESDVESTPRPQAEVDVTNYSSPASNLRRPHEAGPPNDNLLLNTGGSIVGLSPPEFRTRAPTTADVDMITPRSSLINNLKKRLVDKETEIVRVSKTFNDTQRVSVDHVLLLQKERDNLRLRTLYLEGLLENCQCGLRVGPSGGDNTGTANEGPSATEKVCKKRKTLKTLREEVCREALRKISSSDMTPASVLKTLIFSEVDLSLNAFLEKVVRCQRQGTSDESESPEAFQSGGHCWVPRPEVIAPGQGYGTIERTAASGSAGPSGSSTTPSQYIPECPIQTALTSLEIGGMYWSEEHASAQLQLLQPSAGSESDPYAALVQRLVKEVSKRRRDALEKSSADETAASGVAKDIGRDLTVVCRLYLSRKISAIKKGVIERFLAVAFPSGTGSTTGRKSFLQLKDEKAASRARISKTLGGGTWDANLALKNSGTGDDSSDDDGSVGSVSDGELGDKLEGSNPATATESLQTYETWKNSRSSATHLFGAWRKLSVSEMSAGMQSQQHDDIEKHEVAQDSWPRGLRRNIDSGAGGDGKDILFRNSHAVHAFLSFAGRALSKGSLQGSTSVVSLARVDAWFASYFTVLSMEAEAELQPAEVAEKEGEGATTGPGRNGKPSIWSGNRNTVFSNIFVTLLPHAVLSLLAELLAALLQWNDTISTSRTLRNHDDSESSDPIHTDSISDMACTSGQLELRKPFVVGDAEEFIETMLGNGYQNLNNFLEAVECDSLQHDAPAPATLVMQRIPDFSQRCNQRFEDTLEAMRTFDAKVESHVSCREHLMDTHTRCWRKATVSYWNDKDKLDYLILKPEFIEKHICPWIGRVLDAYVGQSSYESGRYAAISFPDK